MRSKDVELAEKLGEKSKEYYSLNNTDKIEVDFAQKSGFHGQIMGDGYIFNPYIHRRWLPAQYSRITAQTKRYHIPVETYVEKYYSMQHLLDIVKKEIGKLELLRRSDTKAFEERKMFFTVDVVKKVMDAYLRKMLEHVTNDMLHYTYSDFFHTGYGSSFLCIPSSMVTKVEKIEKDFDGSLRIKTEYRPTKFINALLESISNIEKADTYYEIQKEIKKYAENFETFTDVKLPSEFFRAFHLAGAYYTLKNEIMFNSKEVNGKVGAEACAAIKDMLMSGATPEEFDALL